MKTSVTSAILIIAVIMTVSCKRIIFSHPMSISKIITYTEMENTDCSAKLKHVGEEAVLEAYIQKMNTFANENRFQVFESADIGSNRMDVNVNGNSKDVFDKISQNLNKAGDYDFTRIKVKGVITGKALYMNGKCKMGLLLSISSPDNIKF
jgi:hypothetical protein